jgi:hypothetical protein
MAACCSRFSCDRQTLSRPYCFFTTTAIVTACGALTASFLQEIGNILPVGVRDCLGRKQIEKCLLQTFARIDIYPRLKVWLGSPCPLGTWTLINLLQYFQWPWFSATFNRQNIGFFV